jgi:hypothetical protein
MQRAAVLARETFRRRQAARQAALSLVPRGPDGVVAFDAEAGHLHIPLR